MINDLTNSVLQVVAFALIPTIVYLIWFRSKLSLPRFLGIYKTSMKPLLLGFAASLIFLIPSLVLVVLSPSFAAVLADPETMTGRFAQEGPSLALLVSIAFTALIKTSLSEEILFRGFVAKRLIAWLGFQRGNLLQALIFGAIHVLIFALITDEILFIVFIFSFSTLGAWVSAHINEKMADGSILPGWVMHGVANFGSYTLIGLVLL